MSKNEHASLSWGRLTGDQTYEELQHEVVSLQRDIELLISDFWNGRERAPTPRRLEAEGALSPQIDEAQDETGFHFKVELPGMDENDVKITFEKGLLTIRGEKKQEEADKGRNFYRKERSFGSFRLTLPILADVGEAKIDSSFKKGVLSINLPTIAAAKTKAKPASMKATWQ